MLGAQLVNELVEAAAERVLSKTIAGYGRVDLLCLDLCRGRNYAEGHVRLLLLAVTAMVSGSGGRWDLSA